MNISVADMLRYVASKGRPISGLAIMAFQNGWSYRTIIMTEEDNIDDEFCQSIKLEKYKWRYRKRRHKRK